VNARRAIEDRLRSINEEVTSRFLRDRNLPLKLPVSLRPKGIASTDAGPSFSMATLIPLILILMTVTGAVYPAIDLTAGERERGTLEALISAPVPRHELLFAKYLAVLAVAMLTALANLTSMIITAYSNGMEQLLFGSQGINLRMLILILGLLFLFAGFFASLILILTSFARSFKEAQAYLIPVMLVSLAPGVLCLMPGIEMTGWMSVTPLVNIVILSRDVLDGRAQAAWVLTTLLSTILYSTVALSVAAKIFGTDAVLYGGEGGWADMIQRPAKRQTSATLSQAVTCLAFMFPAFMISSGLPTRLMGESVAGHFIGNAVITIFLFAIVPLAMAYWCFVDIRTGFRLLPSSRLSYVAAVILGLSIWPFAIELARWQTSSFEQSEIVQELLRRVTAKLDAIPLFAKLLALALIPAVCEELFFRGYLLTAFRTGMSTPLAVVLSSCLFGLFHVIGTMSFERFAPTCFLGLILGWVCYRTGSVLPGMLLHVTHNSLILLMQTYMKQLARFGFGTESAERVPTLWLMSASAAVAIAVSLLVWNSKRRENA
jgi:ABC-2 type transport system permease protein/sodium transport system permease protein